MTNARRARRAVAGFLTAVGAGCVLACASHADALARGQRYYEENQYERALALWRDLDRRNAAFGPAERARYAYFRGMTDYRLGYRDDARHWLAIARATEALHPGGLGPVWLDRLDSALADLARATRVMGQGPDAVQTIEAPRGSAQPGDSEVGAGDLASPPALEAGPSEPAFGGPTTGEPPIGDPAGNAPLPSTQPESRHGHDPRRPASDSPGADAGAPTR